MSVPRKALATLALVVMAAAAASAGCARASEPEPAESKVKYTYDVPYGNVNGRPLLLHITEPDPTPKKPMPAVVYLHGGGWMTERSKASPNPVLARRGYFTVNVDYRLTDEAVFPAQIEDVKAAIRWVRANAKQYNVDPKRIGVWGWSAGGHLAALAGTSGDIKGLEGNAGNPGQSSRVQAVVNMAGVIDLLKQPWSLDDPATAGALLVGGAISTKPDLVKQTNPITYITKDDPPVLTIHGGKDQAVPLVQSQAFHAALQAAGVHSELVILEKYDHGIATMGGLPPDTEKVVVPFFDKYLKGK